MHCQDTAKSSRSLKVANFADESPCCDDAETNPQPPHEATEDGYDFVAKERGERDDEENADWDEPPEFETTILHEIELFLKGKTYSCIQRVTGVSQSTIWWWYMVIRAVRVQSITKAT